MNRLKQLFSTKDKDILNIYFTVGYPNLNDTETIILELEKAGVDLIELGMPYSDPLADGPTIQESGSIALKNGMTLDTLFNQVASVREKTDIPLVMMGYVNQMMQYGDRRFLEKCKEVGIDGLILPDLPLYEYEEVYKPLFEELDMYISFLVSPQTHVERIHKIDDLSRGFVYMVSGAAVTGAKSDISNSQVDYFDRINEIPLKNPRLIGFGISSHEAYSTACKYSNGVIIGSAFIKALGAGKPISEAVPEFVQMIRGEVTV